MCAFAGFCINGGFFIRDLDFGGIDDPLNRKPFFTSLNDLKTLLNLSTNGVWFCPGLFLYSFQTNTSRT